MATTKKATTKYRVVFERDESGWWVVSVPTVQGCHTQGRTLAEGRRRIREALGLFVDDADTAQLVEHVRMPLDARVAIKDYMAARMKAAEVQQVTRARAKKAARLLAGARLKLSRRDAAEVLKMSPQRVQQLLET